MPFDLTSRPVSLHLVKLKIKRGIGVLYRLLLNSLTELVSLAVSSRSKALASALRLRFSGPAMFVPYSSPDCLALHKGLCKRLNTLGITANIETFPQFVFMNYLYCGSCDGSFANFQARLQQGLDKHGLLDLYYPILDSFIRVIPYDYFFVELYINDSFYHELLDHIEAVVKSSSMYSACFLADSAYMNNNIIKQSFLSKNKPVYYLNPTGKLLQYTEPSSSESCGFGIHLNAYEMRKTSVEAYLKSRFSGKSKSDLDSSRAYAESKYSCFDPTRKVLFLHAFRDANNNEWRTNQPFDSYFEWIDFTFNVLQHEDQFEKWYIKQHPSSSFYENDTEILETFLQKYNVPRACLCGPSTSYILKNNMCIFTNNGTVVLEAAANGSAAFFCGARFDKSYGIYASTREIWRNFLLADISHAMRLEEPIVSTAKYHLYYDFDCKNIAALCPRRPILPGESKRNILALLRSQLCTKAPGGLDRDIIPQVNKGNHDYIF